MRDEDKPGGDVFLASRLGGNSAGSFQLFNHSATVPYRDTNGCYLLCFCVLSSLRSHKYTALLPTGDAINRASVAPDAA
jgi:hypothetical protein